MGNYSILERNTLDGLSEPAGILYLKLLDVFQGNEYRAFKAACRYEDCCANTLQYILDHMPNPPDDETRRPLFRFLTERYRHNLMEEENG